MNNIINEEHNTFIRERLITNNILLGYELTHSLNWKKLGRNFDMTLKLDISKVHKYVEWTFLVNMIRWFSFMRDGSIGLCNVFEIWLYLYRQMDIKSIFFHFQEELGKVTLSSLFLFMIHVESFSYIIEYANLHSLKVATYCRTSFYLLFVDDLVIFSKS